jgi:signal transduction histidine kinase/ligand-binding sensor domain-containing protein/DNA-binding response OmpR family regulator
MLKKFKFLFLFFAFSVFSQTEISFRQLSVLDGLSQNSAISIAQDHEGFLWIATQDGLNKYDGNGFNVFPFQFEDITKPNYSYLGKVYCFSDQSIWSIPSDRKLYRYDSTSNSFKKKNLSFTVASFLIDQQNTSWFGSYNSGLYYQDFTDANPMRVNISTSDSFTLYDLKQVVSKKIIIAGTGILGEVNADSKIYTSFLSQATQINFSSISGDKSGFLWVGSYGNGIWVKSINQPFIQRISEIFPTLSLPNSLNVQDVHVDKENRIWIATYGDGLYLISSDRKTSTHFKHQKQNSRSIHYDDVLSIFEDYSGTIWFGTDGGGLSYYDSFLEKFIPYLNSQTPESISIDVVRAIVKDQNNMLWIGTSGKGLTRLNLATSEWKTFTTVNLLGLKSDRIMSLHSMPSGDLWIGTQDGGLHILHPDGLVSSQLNNNPFGPHTIWQIFKDEKSQIWLATRDKGLVLVDEQGYFLNSYDFKSLIKNEVKPSIRTIREGGGYLWLGTDFDGLIQFDPETGKVRYYMHSPNKNSISSDQIKSIFYQQDSNLLWIGTNGKGLDVLDLNSQKFYNFNKKDGLANDVIYGILSDSESNLWLSSNKGITKFTIPNDLNLLPQVVNFSNYDGLATEFNTGAYYKSESGELYFGSLEGFYAFTPQSIRTNTISPKTKITKLDVFSTSIPLSNSVELSSEENTLTFYFAALQFSSPKQKQFKYRLLPHDTDWVSVGSIPFARYTNLKPGSYTFEVISANYDGIWSTKGDSLSFVIFKPWYATTLAYIIYSLILLLILYWLYLFFKAQIDLKIKQNEAEQWKKVNSYKSKLFSDLSHEIRTPLTLMSVPLEQQLANTQHTDKVKSDLEAVSKNKDRILKLVEQLQELTQVELNSHPLVVKEGDLFLLITSIVHSYSHLAQEKKNHFTYDITIRDKAWFNDDIIYKIVTNLLSNAVKFCPTKGTIHFKANLDLSQNLHIEVCNDIENPLKKPSQLFDRFYRENYATEGLGIGLALAKELAELHKGSLSIDESQVHKANFILELPLLLNKYADDEIDKMKVNIEIASLNKDAELSSILVVEDHLELRAVLTELFQPNFIVFESTNGKEALRIAKKELPDIILSDVMMPEMDGLQLCHELKTNEITSHIPVILLTAKTDNEAEWNGISEGADAYIKKPFRVDLLQLKVKKLLENRKLLRDKYKNSDSFKPSEFEVTSTEMKVMEKLQTVIDQKLRDCAFDVTQFCAFMGMSRMQLHRKLKAVTGQSTSDFMKSNRLKIADSLLLNSDLQIAEIAYMSGFNSSSYFIKSYKEMYQITPSERRNKV